jgi:hypothetical protein
MVSGHFSRRNSSRRHEGSVERECNANTCERLNRRLFVLQ